MVHQRVRVRRDLYLEHAHVFVFKRQVVAGLGGDLDFGRSLSGENDRKQQDDAKSNPASHEARF